MSSYPVERYLRYRTIRSPQFGPGDDSLYFRCNLTGNHEIWELSAPRRWPRQRTFTGRDLTFASWSPSGAEMAFGMSSGGGEREQLYLLDDETETVTRLTDEADVVHRWGGWSRDGARFTYAANRRQPGVFDVYTQGRAESHGRAKLVFEQDRPSPVQPIGWGPDDGRLLVLEAHSNYNTDVHLVDLDTGTTRLLTPGPSKVARYQSVRWGPDGESLYLITDYDHNWRYIARLELATGQLEPVVQTDANIKSLILHPGEGRLAYKKDENGFTDVVMGRFRGPTDIERFPKPDLPKGTVESLTMSSDGQRVATVYYVPGTKPDLYSIAVETGESTRWTDTTESVPNDTFVTPDPLTYESFDGLEIPSFYAEPETAGEESQPALVNLHPGPRQRKFPSFDPLRQYYVAHGFVRLDPNYRGSSGYGKEYMELDDMDRRPDAIRDVKAAGDWLANQENVDGNRIALMGLSYGGFLVLAAMTRWPNRFAAGVAISPIANFETYLENTSPWRRKNREAEYGSLDEDRDLLRELSPIHDIDRLQSPLLVVHGTDDATVPVQETEQIAETAQEHDAPVETLFIDGADHTFRSTDHRVEVFERSAAFLDAHT